MQIAFRRNESGLMAKAIQLATCSIYSHCEIVMAGGLGQASSCFSASWRDDGVRTKRFVLKTDHWDTVNVSIDAERLARFIAKETGKPYDRFGMVFWASPVRWFEDKDKWFCSELCAKVLGLPHSWRFSPGSLYERLTGEQR